MSNNDINTIKYLATYITKLMEGITKRGRLNHTTTFYIS